MTLGQEMSWLRPPLVHERVVAPADLPESHLMGMGMSAQTTTTPELSSNPLRNLCLPRPSTAMLCPSYSTLRPHRLAKYDSNRVPLVGLQHGSLRLRSWRLPWTLCIVSHNLCIVMWCRSLQIGCRGPRTSRISRPAAHIGPSRASCKVSCVKPNVKTHHS